MSRLGKRFIAKKKYFDYKSEYRVIKPDSGSSMSEDIQALSNLA